MRGLCAKCSVRPRIGKQWHSTFVNVEVRSRSAPDKATEVEYSSYQHGAFGVILTEICSQVYTMHVCERQPS
jgi:hypothetical protein